MTVEQDDAMRVVLNAVTEAVKTGLTKSEIIDRIEIEGAARHATLRPKPRNGEAPQRYGWSALAGKKTK